MDQQIQTDPLPRKDNIINIQLAEVAGTDTENFADTFYRR